VVAMRPFEPSLKGKEIVEYIEFQDDVFLMDEEEEDMFRSNNMSKVQGGYHSKTMTANRYEKKSVQEIANDCAHLEKDQRKQLGEMLLNFERLFNGKLKKYTGPKVHLELIDGAVPHRSKTFQIPLSQRQLFKKELDKYVEAGVLEHTGQSEWIAGSWIIPKKDGAARWISDFRGLNRNLKRRVYPLPKIGDIMLQRRGYKFVTKLDVSMQYYTFVLDEDSQELCVIATPFVLYKYKRLPM